MLKNAIRRQTFHFKNGARPAIIVRAGAPVSLFSFCLLIGPRRPTPLHSPIPRPSAQRIEIALQLSAQRGERLHLLVADLAALTATVRRYAFDILGLRDEKAAGTASGRDYVTPLVEMLLDERLKARAAKDWAASDRIRDGLTAAGIRVKDRKDGTDWELE